MHSKLFKISPKISPKISQFFILAITALTLSACGGSGGSSDFSVGDTTGFGVGGGAVDNNDPDVVNGINLRRASFVLEGPSQVGAGSTSNYTVTLLNENGIPPVAPPGVNIELDVEGDGFTNPPDGGDTDRDGKFNFNFTAPSVGGQTVIRAILRNGEDEIVRTRGITVSVLETLFQFTSPPDDTQILIGEALPLQFNWRIGNQGATTGNQSQGSPSAITFTLAGRPAGGGFRLGNSTTVQSSVVVNIVNGALDQNISVVAGDTGGAVNVIASASTNSQGLSATLPLVFVGEPTRIEATPTNIGVPQQGAELLTVQVFDLNDTPLSGIPLRFRISICIDGQNNATTICNGSGERITRELRTTNSAGETTTGFIAGDTNGGGELEITVNGGPATGLERAIVYNVGGTSSGGTGTGTGGTGGTGGTTQVFNFPSNGAQIPLGSTQDVVFNLRDSDGTAVAGQAVTFSITRGLIDNNPNTAPAPANTRSFTSDGAGDIRFQVFSNEVGLATLSGGSTQLDVEFIQALQDIAVVAANATIAPGGTNTITATALDANGDPVQGVSLQFILDANTTGGSRTPASGISDDQGQVTTTYTAGTGTGTVVVRASNQTQAISDSISFQVAP